MSKRILSLALAGYIVLIFINWSCTKLDTTTVGSDLIPPVDNIKTFADTLSINSVQGVFDGIVFGDTTKLTLTDNYVVGKTADPIFGQTDATLFLQLKPGFYPYYIGVPNDTITSIDSVVLCLNYKGAYGDTTPLQPIQLQVNEVSPDAHGLWDTLSTLRDVNFGPEIGQALSDPTYIDLASLGLYKKIGKGTDSVINQIRIKLNNTSFINRLFDGDSLTGGFSRDTLFRSMISNGFAVSMISGNALLYSQLSDANTRLELHYKRKNAGIVDTSMTTFVLNTGSGGTSAPRRCAVADKIVRTRNSLPSGDQEIYLQAAPGTFATLTIPQLSGYSNRIVHRAEIILEQIPDLLNPTVSDNIFKEPSYLYLDLVDSGTTNKWKPIYYDLNPSLRYDPDNTSGLPYYPVTGEVDLGYLGAAPKKKVDAQGITRSYYTLNITRYLQRLVTKQTPNYSIRIYAPHSVIYPQYASTIYPYVNNIAEGRVRVGGGSNTNPDYRMRLRVIYSKTN